ncbi:hypothetical protein SAMN05444273_1035 [Litoreibacter ascidiaceicola]|uniref:Uncharacterized protein n=1 Tax=Litoreibacter ascidiaceicola TaxID=1486859 RepID=A0A1M4X1N6_9RHOB|nr:hypothetical protein [Litoreibacter ascidiaceicola]SHE87297.1 hypothetical protein SAMN05444273_1035 [Litoreibacter ascidiaceicola]
MSAAARLCDIIAQGGKVSADFDGGDDGLTALARHGYLREAGVLASVVCDECDAPHSAPVVYEADEYGHYCPDLGFLKLDPTRLAAFSPDVPKLIDRLSEALGCRQRKSSSVYGETWRIGAAQTEAAAVMLYFHPTLATEENARELHHALAREARSEWRLVVTAQGALPIAGLPTVRLDELAEINLTTGALRVIADPGVLAGLPRKNPGGRPSVHGDVLRPLIEGRIRDGAAVVGVNAEAGEVRDVFEALFPNRPIPSASAIKRYIREARRGS